MIKRFSNSYPDYYKAIEEAIFPGIRICEIGPSGRPSIRNSIIKARNLNYTIVDIETKYWDKYHSKIHRYEIDLQEEIPDKLIGSFDLVISQMVLEHIWDPKPLHSNIYKLLSQNGSAIHIYANPYSLSAIVNGVLPERIGEYILKKLKNRNLDKNHKYPAFYKWCFSPSAKATIKFEALGYRVVSHIGYPGHNYFQYIPILKYLEELYSWLLTLSRIRLFSTLSLLHVKK